MRPSTPTEADMQAAADTLLAESRQGTARPTVSALAQRAGITRPTLYRNYPALVEQFIAQVGAIRQAIAPHPRATHDLHDRITRLRQENEQLRLHLDLYEEHIRRLGTENSRLASELAQLAGVADLASQRRRHNATGSQ